MTEHLGQMSLYQAIGDGLWAIGKRLEARGEKGFTATGKGHKFIEK
jgi:hypothetical protein